MNPSLAYQSLCKCWEKPTSFCNYLQDEVILSSKSCQKISVNDFSLLWFASTRRGTNPVLQLPLGSGSLGQRLRRQGQSTSKEAHEGGSSASSVKTELGENTQQIILTFPAEGAVCCHLTLVELFRLISVIAVSRTSRISWDEIAAFPTSLEHEGWKHS